MPRLLCCAVVIAIAVLARPAAADDRPWEQGSTPAQREQAHQLFSQGNDHFFKREYAAAFALYEQAITVFDHPRIRLAMAEVLVFQGRPAEAHAHLEAALRWGAAPFDEDEHARARELQKALARQVGTLIVRCATAGARVSLDGQDLPGCSGETRKVVAPGRHQVVGRKDGYLTFTEDLVVEGGGERAVEVSLKRPTRTVERAVFRRRWSTWKPWAVVAGGTALAVVGVPFQLRAAANRDTFDERCGSAGCLPGDPALDLESRFELQNKVAISLFVVGGAVATTGLVMVYLNRERKVSVAPTITADAVGLAVSGAL